MGEATLSVFWKDHTSELTTVYKSLLEDNFLVDCTLSAEGQSLKAHRLVLSACSSYFQMLFHQETGKHPFIILLDSSFETLKALIDFVYRGETQISEGNLKAFLTLAQSLQIKGLKDFPKDYKSKKLLCSTTENDHSQLNQDTSELQSVCVFNRNNNPENFSQQHPCHSKSYPIEHTNSSVRLEGYSASYEKVPFLQDNPRPLRGEDAPVDPKMSVKCEPVFEDFSETTEALDNNSNEPMTETFASEVDGETSSAYVDQQVNQFPSCSGPSHGNMKSSVMPLSQQQLMQLSGEMSSGRDIAEGNELLLPVNLVPKSEQTDDNEWNGTMDDTGVSGNNTNERIKPVCDEKSLDQYSSTGDSPEESDLTSLQRQGSRGLQENEMSASQFELQLEEPVQRQGNNKLSNLGKKLRGCGVRPASCGVCGVTLAKSGNLVAHMRKHTGERPFVCKVCFKAYSHKKSLVNHMRSHTGERPFLCDVCGEAFARQSILDIHKRRHTGERPYRCDVCGDAFALRSTLTNHAHMHTSERSYRCDVCGKTFARKNYLAIHMRLHTGERPYHCDICGMAFLTSGNRAQHKLTH